jgi:cardiolipin synthase A/B
VLHAKIACCDGNWMTIGSYNINDISAHASVEANVEVNDPGFVHKVEQVLQDVIKKDCQLITPGRHAKTKNIVRQFLRFMAYQLFRFLLFLFTFYFKRKRED